MDEHEVTHIDILKRLEIVENKVDKVHEETRSMVNAFQAVDGAFTVLGWIAKVSKPLIWLGGVIAAASVLWANLKVGK